jgi:hypothetical protein
VDRPGEAELRIFPKYDDPELLKAGNPYLRPQFTQAYELAYKLRWKKGSIFFSGFYRLIDDPYLRIYSIDSTNKTYDVINKIFQNTGSTTNTGLEIIFSQQVNKSWTMSGSFDWYKSVLAHYEGMLLFPYERPFIIEKSTDRSWDIKISNQFALPWKIQLQLTGVYYAPINMVQGKQLARSSVDAGIKKNVIKGKGEITISASDIFNDFSIRQEVQGNGFTALYENYYETQVFRIGFKYKF